MIAQSYILSSNAAISQDMFNPCPWIFRQRIRLMNLPRSQFSLKADLPVGFPYRFNSSFIRFSYHYIQPYVLLRSFYGQKLAKAQGTRKGHERHTFGTLRNTYVFYPAEHTQRPAEKNWHAHYFLRASCDFRFAVSPQGTCTKNVRYPCVSQVKNSW